MRPHIKGKYASAAPAAVKPPTTTETARNQTNAEERKPEKTEKKSLFQRSGLGMQPKTSYASLARRISTNNHSNSASEATAAESHKPQETVSQRVKRVGVKTAEGSKPKEEPNNGAASSAHPQSESSSTTHPHPELTPLQAATKRCLDREREKLKAITTSPPVMGSPARQLLDTAVATAELTIKPSTEPVEPVAESIKEVRSYQKPLVAQPAVSSTCRGNRHASRGVGSPAVATVTSSPDIMDLLPPLGAMGSLLTTSFSMTAPGRDSSQMLALQGDLTLN